LFVFKQCDEQILDAGSNLVDAAIAQAGAGQNRGELACAPGCVEMHMDV
jgi:gamma-glutamyltranspeptidase